jgi:mono/diheme cytochrome c family protein
MRGKSTFLLLGFVLAASGLPYSLTRVESLRHQGQRVSAEGEMTQQNSMQQMVRSMMSGTVPPGIAPGDLPEPGSEGAKLMARYCVQCHNLPSPLMHSAPEWPGVADRMFQRMSMCSRMSGTGMMGNMGGMGMNGMMGSASGMMGMMNIEAPSAKEQEILVAYLKAHSLKSIQPGALPSPRTEGAILFAATCAQCHALPDPKQHTAQDWPQVVARMRMNMAAMGKTVPDAAALRTITEFLQGAARAKP